MPAIVRRLNNARLRKRQNDSFGRRRRGRLKKNDKCVKRSAVKWRRRRDC